MLDEAAAPRAGGTARGAVGDRSSAGRAKPTPSPPRARALFSPRFLGRQRTTDSARPACAGAAGVIRQLTAHVERERLVNIKNREDGRTAMFTVDRGRCWLLSTTARRTTARRYRSVRAAVEALVAAWGV
jgi:hypothetical protein